jgi:hypothetical protein
MLGTLVALGSCCSPRGPDILRPRAFLGIGAYTVVALEPWGISPWIALLVGLAFTVLAAIILGFITLRLSGHYLAITTLAWGIAAYYMFGNFELLGQYNGINNLPAVSLFGCVNGPRDLLPHLGGDAGGPDRGDLLDSRLPPSARASRRGETSAWTPPD